MPVPLTSYKTPGVYVQEIQKLPPSIAQVETAVPVFIGYTQNAERDNQKLQDTPTLIYSQAEYENLFGTSRPEDLEVTLNLNSTTGRRSIKVDNVSTDKYMMYYAIQMFFDNGGGKCYIISVGTHRDQVDLNRLEDALEHLKEYTEPTLILFPDAVEAGDENGYYSLIKAALTHCSDPKVNNCFTITDVPQHKNNIPVISDQGDVGKFREGVTGELDLAKYGAAYYPYLETTIPYVFTLENILIKEDKVDGKTYGEMVTHLKEVLARTKEQKRKEEIEKRIKEFKAKDSASTGKPKEALEKLEDKKKELKGIKDDLHKKNDARKKVLEALKGLDKQKPPQEQKNDIKNAIQSIAAENDDIIKVIDNADDAKIAEDVKSGINKIIEELEKKKATAIVEEEKAKEEAIGVYSEAVKTAGVFAPASLDIVGGADTRLKNEVLTALNTSARVKMPPSSAMAGVYARVDESRGVHKAPANVSLSSVVRPDKIISDEVQDDLNVHISGKSINVIRTFKGIGTLVWGARTLAGNDREWKYIPVRRFFNMVEESVKRALFRFVFEPNNPNTWASIRASIEAFLETQWRAGALLGNTPNDAYFVRVGVPETFSTAEMLDGYMVVEIGMAVVRPAEFIVLKFMHKFELGQ